MRRKRRWRTASMVWGLGITLMAIMVGITACGTNMFSGKETAKLSVVEFQGSGLKPGMVLGWHNRLYQLVGTVNANQVGKKLGQVLYHGPLGQSFVLFTLRGQNPSRVIVFKTTQGQFFRAIIRRH